ncbi:IS3 family transposase [Saccharopolyspora spinosporotrichia]
MDAEDPQADLKEAVTEVFEQAHRRYGHRRVHTILVRRGWQVAKKTVLKLMRALGLVCKVRRRRPYVSWKGRSARSPPTCSTASSPRPRRTPSGSPTSPSSASAPARSTCPQ